MKTWKFRRIKFQAVFAALNLILASVGALYADPFTARAQTQAAEYARLSAKQKALFDDWAKRQNSAEQTTLSPVERYGRLSPSQRTTFEAVAHALSRSGLTSGTGQSIGNAIDMVASLDDIAGQKQGESGDKEFRLYVRLVPDAVRRLESSREFHRGKDNHFFHSGFPINIRQEGRTPTIQFSIAKDEQRADIDVDYRSSHFPDALFNGHLSAENSDVRPANNYRGHVARWLGLIDWWDAQLANFVPRSTPNAVPANNGRTDHLPLGNHPDAPGAREAAAAVDGFLNAWLVKRDVNQAMNFASMRIAVCANVDEDSRSELLNGKQSLLLLRSALNEAVRRVGRSSTLGEALKPIEPHDPGLKLIDHAERNAYALASATSGHYEHFVCNAPASPTTAAATTRERVYGSHYLSVFRLRLPNNQEGGGMVLLWQKQGDRWEIRSFDILSH